MRCRAHSAGGAGQHAGYSEPDPRQYAPSLLAAAQANLDTFATRVPHIGAFESLVFPDAVQRNGERRWQISTPGGWFPEWRRDGREIYYLSSRSEMMATEVWPAGSRLAFGTPRRLFETNLPRQSRAIGSINNHLCAVTADGQRFLVMAPVTDPAQNRIAVILNWTAGLKR